MADLESYRVHVRVLRFVLGCFLSRLLLAFLARRTFLQRAKGADKRLVAALAALPAVGFAAIYLFGWRRTGAEVGAADRRVWWNDLRPVHSCLYAVFALATLREHPRAYLVLLADAILGLLAFLHHL